MRLSVLDEALAILRLPADTPLPDWAVAGGFFSVTRTTDELSVVVAESEVPAGVRGTADYSGGWRALKVEGPLDFELVGVLSGLAGPLARNGVPVFVISTYDTDYLLVRREKLLQAERTLSTEGHELLWHTGV